MHALPGSAGVTWVVQEALREDWRARYGPQWQLVAVGDNLLHFGDPDTRLRIVHLTEHRGKGVYVGTPVLHPLPSPAQGTVLVRFEDTHALFHMPPSSSGWGQEVHVCVGCVVGGSGSPQGGEAVAGWSRPSAVFVFRNGQPLPRGFPNDGEPGAGARDAALALHTALLACTQCCVRHWVPDQTDDVRAGAQDACAWLQAGLTSAHTLYRQGSRHPVTVHEVKAPPHAGKFWAFCAAHWGLRPGTPARAAQGPVLLVVPTGALAARVAQLQSWLPPDAQVVSLSTKAHMARATWGSLLRATVVCTTVKFLHSPSYMAHTLHVARSILTHHGDAVPRWATLDRPDELDAVLNSRLSPCPPCGDGTALAAAQCLLSAGRAAVLRAVCGSHPAALWRTRRAPPLHLVPWRTVVFAGLDSVDVHNVLLPSLRGGGGPCHACVLSNSGPGDGQALLLDSVTCRALPCGEPSLTDPTMMMATWEPCRRCEPWVPLHPLLRPELQPSPLEQELVPPGRSLALLPVVEALYLLVPSAHKRTFVEAPPQRISAIAVQICLDRVKRLTAQLRTCAALDAADQLWVLELLPSHGWATVVIRDGMMTVDDPARLSSDERISVTVGDATAAAPAAPAAPAPAPTLAEVLAGATGTLLDAHRTASVVHRCEGGAAVPDAPPVGRWTRGTQGHTLRTPGQVRSELQGLLSDWPALLRRVEEEAAAVGGGLHMCVYCCDHPCSVLTPCGHSACGACTRRWRQRSMTCPQCKQPWGQMVLVSNEADVPPLPWGVPCTPAHVEPWLQREWARVAACGQPSSLVVFVAACLTGQFPTVATAPRGWVGATVVLLPTASHVHMLLAALRTLRLPASWRPLRYLVGTVEERLQLYAAFAAGQVQLCTTPSDVLSGGKVPHVDTLLTLLAEPVSEAVLRGLRPRATVVAPHYPLP